jgi:hypothetical protein
VANDIGIGLNTYLLAQSAIRALVSDRGFPDVLPQDCVLPAFVYDVFSEEPSHHLSGVSGLRRAEVQFICYATTRKAANELDEAILAAIDMQQGATLGGVPVRTIQGQSRFSDREPPEDGKDSWRYITTREYLVWYIP